jgi:glycine/D-amino acid oxidase-like deaminating enzyme
MDCTFLIIGGGIAGISAAARLAEAGKVIVLEAEDSLAHHASGRSAALYEPRYGLAPVVGLSMASGVELRQAEGVLRPRGLMVVARADQAEEFAAEIAGFAMEETPVEAARAIVPILGPEIAHAAMAEHAWDIDTDLLLQGYAKTARAAGTEIRVKARVTAIRRIQGGWEVTAGAETITAERIVNAAGAWVDQVAVMAGLPAIGFTPYRRSMARIPAPGGHDISGWPMIFGCGESWYAKPDAGALIVSPAEEDLMEPHDAWADDMVLAEGLGRYEAMVTEPVTRLLATWAGLRTFAPDRVLCLGPDPLDPDFIWSAGQGGYGFQTAPAASQLVADLALGRSPALAPDLVAALKVDRFR